MPVTEVRGVVTSDGAGERRIFLNQNADTCKTSCSPRGLFCGSHPSATSYSNGLTGEEEKEEEEEEEVGF